VIISLESVLKAVRLAGSAEPAFAALLEILKPLLSDADQAGLQAIYEAEKRTSDALHRQVQQRLA
jgi:hypothetical protein